MERYRNLSGNSGVQAYEIAAGAITVQFDDGWKYLYSNRSAGAANVAQMCKLAATGRGLCTFISQSVRNGYERKWR